VNADYLTESGTQSTYAPGATVLDAVTPGGMPPRSLAVPDHMPVKTPAWPDNRVSTEAARVPLRRQSDTLWRTVHSTHMMVT